MEELEKDSGEVVFRVLEAFVVSGVVKLVEELVKGSIKMVSEGTCVVNEIKGAIANSTPIVEILQKGLLHPS